MIGERFWKELDIKVELVKGPREVEVTTAKRPIQARPGDVIMSIDNHTTVLNEREYDIANWMAHIVKERMQSVAGAVVPNANDELPTDAIVMQAQEDSDAPDGEGEEDPRIDAD